ncbi:Type I Iterative Polyketide synthase (PKS) [Pseudogymnoascus sp. 05NY08]|nr:Type I Iterative Polyketide synthase (PKS) [Pseudogymnoascus sp. 05NY08]
MASTQGTHVKEAPAEGQPISRDEEGPYFGEGSRLYPSATDSYCLGLCAGGFAAAAVSTSQTFAELIPAGVEAVLTAFRTALCTLAVSNDIEEPNNGHHQSWSAVVNIQEDEASVLIKRFVLEKGHPHSSKPYLSAITPSNVTISGSPSILKEFFAAYSLKFYHIPVELSYHAPHLFHPRDVDEIICRFDDKLRGSYKPRIPIWSAASGKPIIAENFKALLHKVVTDTLREPVQWKNILESTAKLLAYRDFQECAIHALSSNAPSLLSSAISRGTKMLVTVNDLSAKTGSVPHPRRHSGRLDQSKIAVVGYSGRFPDSASNEEFWELLRAGKDVHRLVPEDRFDWEAHYDPTGKTKNTSRVKYGCFIKEPGLFDARFFNISPREAENTDPAQRLAITTTYEALEMAGMVPNRTPSTQQDRIGVFYGVTSDDWREVNSGQDVDTYFIPGGNRAFVPGRISYFFRFSGPSLSIDTACSSSFAAIQIACSNLWRGECDTAIAGGTNVLTNPDNFAGLDRGHFLTTIGNCNAFDDKASGYCRADAVGSVILKRLEDAQADNDPIFGVIVGAYTNHCGQTDSITRPHEGDQTSVFKRIIRHANVNPLDISYVEMHGTGTQAGDATEMNSVLSVFVPERKRMPDYPLYLGSAKANIGHAESASGVSSLIKVLMMMKHNEIPPHCGIKTRINHKYPLDLKERNVNIAATSVPWHRTGSGKRSVFLNNFSAAGGNTAVLLEDAPLLSHSNNISSDPRSSHPVAVSGKSAKSLNDSIKALINFLELNPDTPLPALSYTTTARRMHYSYRTICSGSDIKSVLDALKKNAAESDSKALSSTTSVSKIAFAFSGQGSLYSGIGRQLFESHPGFKADILRFDSIAQQQGFPSFLPLVDGTASDVEGVETVAAHLALSCVQMALCRLWISWGVRPNLTIGHSLGEYAALQASGVLTPSDVIYLVGTRAQLLSNHCHRGTHAMLSIKASSNDIKVYLVGSTCEIACINQPTNNVISGPSEEINRLMLLFQSKGLECIKLDIPFAFHSAQVNPILEGFESAARGIRYCVPSLPYISPLLELVVSDGVTLDASYLARACRSAVNFQGALRSAKEASLVDGQTIWIEIGSHPACSGMIKGTIGPESITIPSLRKGVDTWEVLTRSLETLYLNRINIEWNEWHRDFKSSHTVLQLPRYSWDLKNYWIQYRNNFCLTKGEGTTVIDEPPVEKRLNYAYLSPAVQRVLEEHHAADVSNILVESDVQDPRLAPVFQGHKVNGTPLCPSSLYADIAMTIANYMMKAINMQGGEIGLDVGDMKVDKPLIALQAGNPQLFRVSGLANWALKTISLVFYSVNDQGGKKADHATCHVKLTSNQTWLQDWKRNAYLIKSRIASLQKCVDEGESNKLKRGLVYKLFGAIVEYDPQYQGMQEVILDSNELEATAKVTFQVGDGGYGFSPHWIDSLGHIAGFIMNGNDNVESKNQVFINHGWDAMRCATTFAHGKTYQTYNKMQLVDGTLYAGDTYILEEGNIAAIFEGVKFLGISRKVLDQVLPSKPGVIKNAVVPSRPVPNTSSISAAKPSSKLPIAPDANLIKLPSNDIISQIMAIISDEARLDPSELKSNTEFADFGIDSLLSLTILGRLRDEVGLDLPSTLFSNYPTVEKLQNFIGVDRSPSLSSGSSSQDDTDVLTAELVSEPDTDRLVDIIRNTISEETGVPIEELTVSARLSELGIDSLLALTTMGKLSEALDIEVPQSLFVEDNTLYDLERALDMTIKRTHVKICPNAAKLQTIQEVNNVDSAPHATSVLLQGNSKTATKKLFLFPDGSGSATSYSSLTRIFPDIAVYGLNCPWMKTPQDMTVTLEQLTAKYLLEIRRRQPRGPYYLGGWSAGGICAYEAAQQLSLAGESTARLILIDSPNPVGLENPPQRMYDFFDSLGIFGEGGKPRPSWLRPHFDAFIRLLDEYKVKSFGGKLETHIVYARDGICKLPTDPRPEIFPDDPREMLWLLNNRTDFSGGGWCELVGKENMRITVLDNVNHFTMVEAGPEIGKLGVFIRKAME